MEVAFSRSASHCMLGEDGDSDNEDHHFWHVRGILGGSSEVELLLQPCRTFTEQCVSESWINLEAQFGAHEKTNALTPEVVSGKPSPQHPLRRPQVSIAGTHR